MNLIIQQAFLVFCFGLIHLLLRLKSPPQDILKLISFIGSLVFVLMAWSLSVEIQSQQFVIDSRIYILLGLLIFSVILLVIYWKKTLVWLIVGGTLCNTVVSMVNDWTMPVFYGWEAYNGKDTTQHDPLHTVMMPATNLKLLGDWITIKLSSPFYTIINGVFSLGDMLIMIGIFLLSYRVITTQINKKLKTKRFN